jgi:hypothetical protein
MIVCERRCCCKQTRRRSRSRAVGEAKESLLQQRARSREVEARKVLARIFELLPLEQRAGTVAEEAQTRSTKHDDVSTRGGRSMQGSTAQPRAERPRAAAGADLLDRFAHDDLLRLTMAL